MRQHRHEGCAEGLAPPPGSYPELPRGPEDAGAEGHLLSRSFFNKLSERETQ